MQQVLHINIRDLESFKKKLLTYGNRFSHFVFLDSCNFNKNNTQHSYYEYDFIAALSSLKEIELSNKSNFKNLSNFNKENNDWIFGYLAYDLKNELENLTSKNTDQLEFPVMHFFIPDIVITSKNQTISFIYDDNRYSEKKIKEIISTINSENIPNFDNNHKSITLNRKIKKDQYIETVKKLKQHIQVGDIYEINFCQEFYCETSIDPLKTYYKLREISPAPFSCYYKNNGHYLLSASPERFLKKNNTKIISQPIKGTKRRGENEEDDYALKTELLNDPKEKAENVMIVDLVRNDLSKTAKKGSVKVEELFGIYSFKQVHQMISTIVSEIDENTDIIEVIKNAFPMGSMTGAPKVRSMQLIEQYEKTKRGLYSGAVGFITPDKNFDFNVVIRSILYNESKKYVSFTVGGAITSLAIPEQEYEECMVKAEAMIEVLK